MTPSSAYDTLFVVRFFNPTDLWVDWGSYGTYEDAYEFYVECEELGRFKNGTSEILRREVNRDNPEIIIDRPMLVRVWK